MAPSNVRPTQRRTGNGSGRPAVSAGVNRHRAAAAGQAPRVRDQGTMGRRNRATGAVATGPSLASRMTFTRGQGAAAGPTRGRGVAAAPSQAHTAPPSHPRPQVARPRPQVAVGPFPQTARSLQDQITRADDARAAPAANSTVAEDPNDAMKDDFDFFTPRPTESQASALFCGSQPTQDTSVISRLHTPPPPHPPQPTATRPPPAVRSACTTRPRAPTVAWTLSSAP
jgi:hypothetical protein